MQCCTLACMAQVRAALPRVVQRSGRQGGALAFPVWLEISEAGRWQGF